MTLPSTADHALQISPCRALTLKSQVKLFWSIKTKPAEEEPQDEKVVQE